MNNEWITTKDRLPPYNAEPVLGRACPKCDSQHVDLLEHFSLYSDVVTGTDPMSDTNKKFETRKCLSCGQKWERKWRASADWAEVRLK